MISYLLTLVCSLLLSAAQADEWTTPEPMTVSSQSGEWTVHVTPSKSPENVPVTAQLTGPDSSLSFNLDNTWSPVDVVLLDSGEMMTFDQWHQLGHGKVVTLYGPDGETKWTKELAELLPGVDLDTIPTSMSSRWWRLTPLQFTLVGGRRPPAVVITLWDENQLSIGVPDGRTAVIEVKEPDSVEGRLRRANGLVGAGEPVEALALFEQIFADLGPEAFPNERLAMVRLQQTQGEHQVVVRELTPIVDALQSSSVDPTHVGNLMVSLAESHMALGDAEAQERVLRDAVAVAPTYSYPLTTLARVLLAAGRQEELPPLISGFLEPQSAEHVRQSAHQEAGNIYRGVGMVEHARDTYRKGVESSPIFSLHLYLSLAKVHESLGENDEAAALYTRVISELSGQQNAEIWQMYIDQSNEALTRLEALQGSP